MRVVGLAADWLSSPRRRGSIDFALDSRLRGNDRDGVARSTGQSKWI